MSEWQPISTAPTSTRVLLACKRGTVLIALHGKYLGWMRDDSGGRIFDEITHWMPLPEPPK
ncbi:DUF551 domain-containing protein [Endozoicomonas sp. 4G]|uniref:DUF551 domain-containing protein n=1 Tax=Endozoicomonas sp. 4G TaxID=2872754 RepID=UPI001BCB6485|nr:DUF551 domain-containing protein [Endozoicomonas sp. 4G]